MERSSVTAVVDTFFDEADFLIVTVAAASYVKFSEDVPDVETACVTNAVVSSDDDSMLIFVEVDEECVAEVV